MSLKIGILGLAGLAGCATDSTTDEAARQYEAMEREAPAAFAAWKDSHTRDGVFHVKSADAAEISYDCRDFWADLHWWGTSSTWSYCGSDGTGTLTYQVCTWGAGCESTWSEPVSCTCSS